MKRILFGFLLTLVAVLFLGMAYAEFAHADPTPAPPSCDDALAQKIVELAKADKTGILAMQYELTTLKLADATLDSGSKTVEAYVKNQSDLITQLDKDEVRKKLQDLYWDQGAAADVAKIQAAVQTSVDKIKTASYFDRKTRFKNLDLSAYVYAKMVADPKSYDGNDVAILWYQSQISEGVEARSHRGSAAANLQETSTVVARLTGIAGTTARDPKDIKDQIVAAEDKIAAEFDRITKLYADELRKSCADMKMCKECGVADAEGRISDTDRAKALGTAMQQIVSKLQTDHVAHDAEVQKAVDVLKAKGITVEREASEVGKSSTQSSTASASTTTSTGTVPTPLDVKSSYDLVKTFTQSKYNKCTGTVTFSDDGKTLKFKVSDPADSTKSLCDASYAVDRADLNAWDDQKALSSCPDINLCGTPKTQDLAPIVVKAKKKKKLTTTPPGITGLVKVLDVHSSYNLVKTFNPAKYNKCDGTVNFSEDGKTLNFTVSDPEDSTKSLCDASYAVDGPSTTAWDDQKAHTACSDIELCGTPKTQDLDPAVVTAKKKKKKSAADLFSGPDFSGKQARPLKLNTTYSLSRTFPGSKYKACDGDVTFSQDGKTLSFTLYDVKDSSKVNCDGSYVLTTSPTVESWSDDRVEAACRGKYPDFSKNCTATDP